MPFAWQTQIRDSIARTPHETFVGGWLMILFGIFLMGIGAFDIVPKLRAKDWLPAPAVVVSTELQERHGKGPNWCPWITYEYAAAGQHYRSRNRTSAMTSDAGCRSSKAEVERDLALLPDGSAIEIHYDPAAPGRAAIDIEDVSWFDLFFVLLGIITVAYAGYLMAIARAVLRERG